MRIAAHRVRIAMGAAGLVATLLSSSVGAHASTGSVVPVSERLGHAQQWIVDDKGRVVYLHGVNMPSKLLPATPQSLKFGEDDAALLSKLGFNAVRLTLERYAAEPKAGRFNDAYIAAFDSAARMLARRGIYTLIDFHQDDYGPVFLDNGYPDWMTVTDGLPNLFFSPFPTQYFDNPAQNRAWDHLWANDKGPDGKPLQSDDATLLAHVAKRLRNTPGLLGYEIINEPWPGTQYPNCINPTSGCPAFDKAELSAYYQRTAAAIRAADPRHMIWFEPLVTFNQGVPTAVNPPKVSNTGFAFHDYSLCAGDEVATDAVPVISGPPPAPTVGGPTSVADQCNSQDQAVLNNAGAYARGHGLPVLETEFGATMTPGAITRLVNDNEAVMMPWLFWSYTRYVVALDANSALMPATNANVNWPVVNALVRPYPQLVSGTPMSMHFDTGTKQFNFTYSTSRPDGGVGRFPAGSTTAIAAPVTTYPKGYTVTVTGGVVRSATNSPVLSVAASPGSLAVSIVIKPRAA